MGRAWGAAAAWVARCVTKGRLVCHPRCLPTLSLHPALKLLRPAAPGPATAGRLESTSLGPVHWPARPPASRPGKVFQPSPLCLPFPAPQARITLASVLPRTLPIKGFPALPRLAPRSLTLLGRIHLEQLGRIPLLLRRRLRRSTAQRSTAQRSIACRMSRARSAWRRRRGHEAARLKAAHAPATRPGVTCRFLFFLPGVHDRDCGRAAQCSCPGAVPPAAVKRRVIVKVLPFFFFIYFLKEVIAIGGDLVSFQKASLFLALHPPAG